jgi:hypothetical protein
MRGRLVIFAIGIVAAVVVADLGASSFIEIGHGSAGVVPQTDGLQLLPAGPDCEALLEDPEEPCPRRYAYRPGQSLVAWISVRNNGPVPVTVRGVSRAWLDQYVDIAPLGAPMAGLDGGDGFQSIGDEISGTAFEPVVLDPGDERLVGVEFRTTDDSEDACARWIDGAAVQWAAMPIAWHWLFIGHETELAFAEPIDFMAPTDRDCA